MFDWFKSKSPQPIEKPKTLGQLGEEFAQEEYKKKGFKILASNYYNPKGLRRGEVDFIAINNSTIAFVEVKTRKNRFSKFGTAMESVNIYKQKKLLKTIKIFLLRYPKYCKYKPRVDVCAIGVDKGQFYAKIIENAVEDWN